MNTAGTEASRIERALKEWMDALDSVREPIFIHDQACRILRCNRAYQKETGLPFKEIIGRRYYELFPKTADPHCGAPEAPDSPGETGAEKIMHIGDRVYRCRSYPISDVTGSYLYSVRLLEDITERRETENRLRNSEAFIKAVLDNLPIGIAVNSAKPPLRFAYMNDNFPACYRTTREQLESPDTFWEAVYEDPRFREQIRERVLQDLASGDPDRMVWRDIPITRRGEATTYISAQDIPLPEKESVISMVWDVTERRRALELLESEKDFSDALIRNLPDIFFLLDPEGRLIQWNQRLEELYGVPPDQMQGIDAMSFIHEEDRPRITGKLAEALTSGSATAEGRLNLTNGLRHYLLTGRGIDTPEGRGIIGFGVDVTELKEAEARLLESENRFKAIFERASDGILLADMATRKFTAGNPMICKMLGYLPGDITGLGVEDIHPEEELPAILEEFAKRARGDFTLTVNVPMKRKDGTRFFADINSFPITIDGRPHLAGIFRDVTERIEAAQQLRQERDFSERLVDTAQAIILVLNPEGRIVRFNRFTEELTGYALDEVKGLDWFETFVPDVQRQSVQHHFRDIIQKVSIRPHTNSIMTKKGQERLIEWNSKTLKNPEGQVTGVLATGMDVTERQTVQKRLQLFHALLDHSSDGVEILDPDTLRFLDINETKCRNLGYSRDEMLKMSIYDIDPEFTPDDLHRLKEAIRQHGNARFERLHRRKDGTTFPVEVNATLVEFGHTYLLAIVRDITERKQTEAALQSEATRRRVLMESSRDGIAIFNQQHEIVEANTRFAQMLGYTPEELLDLHTWDFEANMGEDELRAAFANLLEIDTTIETRHRRKDGSLYDAEVSISGTLVDGQPMVFTITRDISERTAAARALRASEEKHRMLFESSRDALMVLEPSNCSFIDGNAAALELFKIRHLSEFVTLTPWDLSPPRQPDGRLSEEKGHDLCEKAMREGSLFFEWEHQTIDGDTFAADILINRVELEERTTLQVTMRDITERKVAEQRLSRTNRTLKMLSAGNLALVRAQSEQQLLQDVSDIIVRIGGHSMAVVYYAENDPDQSITPQAWAGIDDAYFGSVHLSARDLRQQNLPVVMAIRSGSTQIRRQISNAPEGTTYNPEEDRFGYHSSAAFPLSHAGAVFGGLCIYSPDAAAFDGEEVKLLEEMAEDLAYGVITQRTRVAHEQHAVLLRRSLEQSIQTIAATVEARDPYTAGHQRRVAELATAIAREMDLDDDKVNGIHLAATIHDLGKVHIPAEILSKPGRLSDIEYLLIQTHPEDGYQIIKDVAFPWPIAEIIRQHHEKLDGSGYPRGLKEDAILLEARIIAVADVVEAMSTHRPYRPALGIDPALDEIRRGRGTIYDTAAVEACLRLFKEQRFAFSDA